MGVEDGENGKSSRKLDNIIQFPNREGGFEEIADDLIQNLQAIIETNPLFHITEEDIQKRVALFLKSPDRATTLKNILEDSERESDELFRDKGKVFFYLAAALAYKKIPPEEKEE